MPLIRSPRKQCNTKRPKSLSNMQNKDFPAELRLSATGNESGMTDSLDSIFRLIYVQFSVAEFWDELSYSLLSLIVRQRVPRKDQQIRRQLMSPEVCFHGTFNGPFIPILAVKAHAIALYLDMITLALYCKVILFTYSRVSSFFRPSTKPLSYMYNA